MNERFRIDFIQQRDGTEACIAWVRRTMLIYRRAMIDRRNFAGSPTYRREFIEAYCEFKRWLARQD